MNTTTLATAVDRKLSFLVKGPERGPAQPLWEAAIEILRTSESLQALPFRELFVSRSRVAGLSVDGRDVLPPGVIAAQCRIVRATLHLEQDYVWSDNGASLAAPSLLLLQAQAEEWEISGGKLRFKTNKGFNCLAGELKLGNLTPPTNDWRRHFPNLANIEKASLRLHGSGLSLRGQARLPWKEENDTLPATDWHAIPAFDAAPLEAEAQAPALHVALDRERLQRDTALAFHQAWQELNAALLPADFTRRPRWASLELVTGTPENPPDFYWEVSAHTNAAPRFKLGRETLHLLLADQPLGDAQTNPRSLCRALPGAVEIVSSGARLTLRLADRAPLLAAPADPHAAQYHYTARHTAAGWTEEVALTNLTTVYDPLETAQHLRRQHGLATPDPLLQQTSPALLWGCAPLADGWAQLPVLNLTEQMYLDVFAHDPAPPTETEPLLFGALTLGNDVPAANAMERGEQQWNVTLLNATHYGGVWQVQRSGDGWQGENVTLWFQQPEVALNGFFWLATEAPSAADALPSLDNWLAGLRMIPLRSLLRDELYPAPFVCRFDEVRLRNAPDAPALQQWSYRYAANQQRYRQPDGAPVFTTLVKTLIERGQWQQPSSPDRLWEARPLVWRRHPHLPAIQSLPLTQSQTPPHHPSPNRQLAPFELPVEPAPEDGSVWLPQPWQFDAPNAAQWPKLLSAAEPARVWLEADTLRLAALSVPGLAFDPAAEHAPLASTTGFLAAGYHYGLPYTDEVNALAQLPKDPAAAPPEPAAPVPALRREDYEAFWRELAERAFLAQPDGDAALVREPQTQTQTERTYVQGLAEPHEWTVTAALEEKSYPGALLLKEGGKTLRLGVDPQNTDAPDGGALRGLHGAFIRAGNALKLAVTETAAQFHVEAGTLAATSGGAPGRLRDQRGLWRSATEPAQQGGGAPRTRLLKTAVEREGDKRWQLGSLLESLALAIQNGAQTQTWQLWFRDVPLHENKFDRTQTRSAQRRGINDPAATASAYAHLTGYEWRLAEAGQTVTAEHAPLKLLAYDFYPLTLDAVTVAGDAVASVQMTGRLQPPTQPAREETDLHNAVQLTFESGAGGLTLKHIRVAQTDPDAGTPADYPIEWPLGENAAAASLFFQSLAYQPETGALTLQQAWLEFTLFDVRWQTPYRDFTDRRLSYARADLPQPAGAAIAVEFIALDLAAATPALRLKLAFHWGKAEHVGLDATAEIDLLAPTLAADGFAAHLRHGAQTLAFAAQQTRGAFTLAARAVQFQFGGLPLAAQKERQLLPGMHLSAAESVHGFAVLAFDAEAVTAALPVLRPRSAFLEFVLPCEWGRQLQEPLDKDTPEAQMERVFESSAGRLYGGYTLTLTDGNWQPALLLNGFLEVKNLISWPAPDLAVLPEEARLVHFDSNDDDVEDDYDGVLERIARVLHRKPTLTLRVEGHADSRGGVEENLKLSRERADEVKERLVEKFSVPAARISTAGFGETRLRVPEDTPAGLRFNRRAELILQPEPAAEDKAGSFTLPALRHQFPALRPALHHWRHTARIFFNQHQLPAALLAAGDGLQLFNFPAQLPNGRKPAWQLLAVVEHQLLEVRVNEPQAAALRVTETRNESRWTAVQEVRLCAPAKLQELLTELHDKKYLTLSPQAGERPQKLLETGRGFQRQELVALLLGERGLPDWQNVLLVEASAPHWLRLDQDVQAPFTNLQYLARGTQRAMLSVPEDFASRAADKLPWLLLALPLLGRLQARAAELNLEADWLLNQNNQAGGSWLQYDPVILLDQARRRWPATTPLPELPRALAAWEDAETHTYNLAEFDLAAARRWERLDPATLAESWFRLQNPPPETSADANVVSVLAALPADSPGRLSRPAALAQLFESARYAWPPRAHRNGDPTPEAVEPDRELLWRRQHLFVTQGVSRWTGNEVAGQGPGGEELCYGFYFTGAQIYGSPLAQPPAGLAHYCAATMFPARLPEAAHSANRMPVSFAVSPYLGLHFQPLTPSARTLLTVAELLCLDPQRQGLRFVTSQLWETAADLDAWGREVHSRLAADSPVAVLRIRRVKAAPNAAANATEDVVIEYEFRVLAVQPPVTLVRCTRHLRSELQALRFVEGQFGGHRLPPLAEAQAQLFNFEVAPPQVRGVQPLYLYDRPGWPWGLSALRFSLRHTQSAGVVGALPAPATPLRLWWSALAHEVQYALTDRANRRRLLPPLFRARAVRGLLPAAPAQPAQLPAGAALQLQGEAAAPATHALDARLRWWQPLLPEAFRCLVLGARPGAPLLFRQQVLAQHTTVAGQTAEQTLVASGAVPVQHRAPRPMPLRANQAEARELALRTWAAYFDPTHELQAGTAPTDNAFLAASPTSEAVSLALTLVTPANGVITPNEDGALRFKVEAQPATLKLDQLEFRAELVIGVQRFAYQAPQLPDAEDKDLRFALAENGSATLRGLLNGLPHGTPATINVAIQLPFSRIAGYRQQLRFPLRLAQPAQPAWPLQPWFIQFEDPEYNRRLASATSSQSGFYVVTDTATQKESQFEVTLAADRREYNSTSQLFVTLFGQPGTPAFAGTLSIKRLSPTGSERVLVPDTPLPLQALAHYDLGVLAAQQQVTITPGDALVVMLTATGLQQPLSLRLDIVAQPVTPAPEAGYALLRQVNDALVECARFAWSPVPSRIELVNPDDLQQTVVRRRAVFQWQAVGRPQQSSSYALQKITFVGATHIPKFTNES